MERIYTIGADSVGKTKLARKIGEITGLPVIAEVARTELTKREIGFEDLHLDLDETNEYQWDVYQEQMKAEEKHKDGFVSSRGFDHLGYAAEFATNLEKIYNDDGLKEYLEWIKGGLIFFLRPNKRLLKEDPYRIDTDWDRINRFDGMMKFIFEAHGIKYMSMRTSSFQERVNNAMLVIDLNRRASSS